MYVFNQININMTTSKSIPFDGRNIVLIDENKDYALHSVESVLGKNLNNWKDWYCAAGLNSIYIDYDGNIYNAVCREGGVIGNVYNLSEQLNSNKDWITCSMKVCTCGADMEIPKVKNKEYVVEFFKGGIANEFALGQHVEHSNAEMVISTNDSSLKTITWALGRRCNFDCWYCPESDHNNYEEHKTFEQMMSGYRNLEKFWINGSRVKFSMLGGELTVFKDYLPFVKELYSLGHRAITTTNGSRNAEYYRELSAVSDVCFSIHLNYVKELGIDKFLDSVEQAIQGRGLNWVNVRIMVDPGNLEIAQEVYSQFKQKFGDRCPINVKPVHPAPNQPLYKYTAQEIIWIRKPS